MISATDSRIRVRECKRGNRIHPDQPQRCNGNTNRLNFRTNFRPGGLQAPIRKNLADLLGPADRLSGVRGRPLNIALDLERPVRQFSILGLRQKGIEAAAVIDRPERRG